MSTSWSQGKCKRIWGWEDLFNKAAEHINSVSTAEGWGGDFAPNQIRGGKFRGAPWILCGTPRQSPQRGLLVCEKFAENPEFRVGNFAVNLKREISHAKFGLN